MQGFVEVFRSKYYCSPLSLLKNFTNVFFHNFFTEISRFTFKKIKVKFSSKFFINFFKIIQAQLFAGFINRHYFRILRVYFSIDIFNFFFGLLVLVISLGSQGIASVPVARVNKTPYGFSHMKPHVTLITSLLHFCSVPF